MSPMKNNIINIASIQIDEISFDDISTFCNQKVKEDIDLDYKSDFPSDLGRLISAFANTQGGIVIIGIDEDGKSREPVCPPRGIEGSSDVLRQRILNIAFDAIYPPVEPEVAIVEIPDRDLYVALIRIAPSRLLHTVDRRRRIYIRSLDNNRGYELATLPDLRWLWDQRETTIKFRESLSDSASRRANSDAVSFRDKGDRNLWHKSPHLIVSITPSFPQRQIIPSTRALLDIANSIGQVRSPWSNVDRRVPWQENKWRTIPSAICLSERGSTHLSQYVELGVYGHAYFDFLLPKQQVSTLPLPRHTNEECVSAYVILANIDIALRYSVSLFEAIPFRWPILIAARLERISNILLQYESPVSRNILGQEFLSLASTDETINLLQDEIPADSIGDNRSEYLYKCARSLLWAFGIGWNESDIQQWLGFTNN